jgi:transcriptional regulator with XRE-family HTH domain
LNVDLEFRKLKIGEKIRGLRLSKRSTLSQVSARTGLSIALLSQIENNAVSPPVATLLRIAKALDVNIGFFFREEESRDQAVVVRKDERKRTFRRLHTQHQDGGYVYEALAYKKNAKHMEPFWVEFEPKKKEDLSFLNHRGGRVPFSFPGTAGLSLPPGGNRFGSRGQPLFRCRCPAQFPGPGGQKSAGHRRGVFGRIKKPAAVSIRRERGSCRR